MSTQDLDSYYPGYEDYEERKSRVPYDDYAKLEEQIKIYKKSVDELTEILYNAKEYKTLEMVNLSKAILEDLKREIC